MSVPQLYILVNKVLTLASSGVHDKIFPLVALEPKFVIRKTRT